MKIKKINQIKYKSYVDFSRDKTCKKSDGNQVILGDLNIFFGENWSWKSTICEVLKSVSWQSHERLDEGSYISCEIVDEKETINTNPETSQSFVKLTGETNQYVFESNNWNDTIDPSSILFFDVDYIHNNIHTHWDREDSVLKWWHTQNSWKLIIELDENANILREAIVNTTELIKTFENIHKELLKHEPTAEDVALYGSYKDLSEEEKIQKQSEIIVKIKEFTDKKNKLTELKINASDVSQISLDNTIFSVFKIPTLEEVNELFTRKLPENSIQSVSENIKSHFEKHKVFLSKDDNYKKIVDQDETHCPLCSQSLDSVKDVINYYLAVFDATYKNEKNRHKQDIAICIEYFKQVETIWKDFPIILSTMFDYFENLQKKYWIAWIYSLEKKNEIMTQVNGIHVPSELNQIIEKMNMIWSYQETINLEDISNLWSLITNFIDQASKTIDIIKVYQQDSNTQIWVFKSKYSDIQEIDNELTQIDYELQKFNQENEFFLNNRIKIIYDLKNIQREYDLLKKDKKDKDDALAKYLEEKIPESVTNNMINILNKFNLSFVLEHTKPSARASNYTFWFRVKDKNGKYRDLKKSLSEWERQIISLAFFFSVLENTTDKNKKILVLDDPITSLDAPNLKILSDLILEQVPKYCQVMLFTHHPLFYKYISKSDIAWKMCFWVFKNVEELWWSFIFCENSKFDLDIELGKLSEEIDERSKNWILQNEELSLKYGQYLRLALEKFIKYDILLWDKEKSFDDVLKSLTDSKNKISQLDDAEIISIINMYKYCNHSNLMHVDKESPSTLWELIKFIDQYLEIKRKYDTQLIW
jgi:wobble nucleotide-excising tRNase